MLLESLSEDSTSSSPGPNDGSPLVISVAIRPMLALAIAVGFLVLHISDAKKGGGPRGADPRLGFGA